jgi:5-formyltetrahydrofolate cyclo-ligase
LGDRRENTFNVNKNELCFIQLHGMMKSRESLQMDIRAEKREIRKRLLAVRDNLDSGEREKASLLLTERILGHQWYYRADKLLCFASYGSEISTLEIMKEAWKAGKKVYVPKVLPGGSEMRLELERSRSEKQSLEALPDTEKASKKILWERGRHDMEFYRIMSLEDLEPGYRGIPEPAGTTEIYVYSADTAEQTLMLMPGVAFDGYRARLGYGRGFYDRYLADRPKLQLRTIAVGYRCQMVDKLPGEDTDIRPCQVICL